MAVREAGMDIWCKEGPAAADLTFAALCNRAAAAVAKVRLRPTRRNTAEKRRAERALREFLEDERSRITD